VRTLPIATYNHIPNDTQQKKGAAENHCTRPASENEAARSNKKLGPIDPTSRVGKGLKTKRQVLQQRANIREGKKINSHTERRAGRSATMEDVKPTAAIVSGQREVF